MFEFLLFVGLVLLVKFVIDKGFKNEYFFRDRGIKYLKPKFFVGNSANIFTRKRNPIDFFTDIYKEFPDEK